MNKIKTLAGETALYGLGSIVPRTINFLLVILHTRIFVPEEYGIFTNLYAWVAFLNVVYLFGMETAYFRFSSKDGANENRVFRIAQTFVVSISLAITIIIVLFSHPIANYFNVPEHPEFVIWLAVLMFVDAAVAIPFARLRRQKKAKQFAFAKLANVAIQVGLNLYFLLAIYNPSVGIGYLLLANLIANLFYLLFFAKTLVTWRPALNKEIFFSMFSYALPIMFTGLAGMANEMYSRTTLTWWLPENFYPGKSSDYALGVFAAGYRLAVIMNLAVQAFRFAAEPFFFSHASNKNSPWLFAKVNHYFTILCCFIYLSVMINLDILKYLIKDSYWEGLGVVPLLLLGYMFLGIYYNFSIWFKLTDKTFYGTIISIGGVVLTVVANYFLIPQFGFIGSSWATLTCYLMMAVVCYTLGQKYYPVPYKLAEEFGYLFFVIFLVEISKRILLPNIYGSIAFHFFVMIFFLILTYWRERKYWASSVE